MKKLTRKLIMSIIAVAFAFVALGTSTYAWFSMNRTVTVSGMEINTVVSDNLFIASTTMDATSYVADDNYTNYLDFTAGGATLIEPVSTIDGKNFFYVDAANDIDAEGKLIEGKSYYAYNANDTSDFVAKNGAAGSVGYKDFVFELKAINGSENTQVLKLTKADLVYKGVYTNEKAFRIAMFIENLTHNADDTYGTYTMVSSATLPAASTILTKASAAYNTTGQAVNSTTTLAAVSVGSVAVSINVPAGKTEYYKVVVRIWLEGEDTTCTNSTFASLNQNWALDLKFELGTQTNTISNFGGDGVAASASGLVGTVTLTNSNLSNGETPSTYQWYNAVTGAAVASNGTAASYTADVNGQYFCKITTTKGNVYYTNALELKNN